MIGTYLFFYEIIKSVNTIKLFGNIETYVLKNKELAIKYADLPKELKNRQEYLDSLSYLQELTYDLYQKSEEEYKEAVKSYFEHCEGEMEKILYQCIDKEGPRAGLEKEQQLWQENFDKRLQETLSIHKCNSMEELLNTDFRFLRPVCVALEIFPVECT